MALANPTVTNGVAPGHSLSVRFRTGGAHANHPYQNLGTIQDINGNQAAVYYCKTDNTILIENG